MEDEKSKNDNPPPEQAKESGNQETKADTVEATTGGWGGWGFSPFSVLSDLQKAAQEISRSASVAAEKAAKSIADIQISEVSESLKEEEETEEPAAEKESDDEDEKRRKSALDKLEKASEESFLGQRLKVIDNSVENLASGAWQALGSAWKGSANFVQKLENSIQQGGLPVAADSVAPSFIETGKAFTAKGMQVLEFVGKETMDLLISETGIEVEKNPKDGEQEGYEDQLHEEVTFDRCFYIYGGPEQLEELEALSNHYALLFNRRKAKLSSEQKSVYDGKLKQVQQIFSLSTDVEGSGRESDKGKKVETGTEGSGDEMKNLHDTSVSKAADMAAGFTNALAGQTVNDIIQRTAGRLESLHSEGVHV
ncbi:BAT2 domain-containing protein [Citrus sinensis]|nr:BAT2 domain-containing protein [Citrus sinensis]